MNDRRSEETPPASRRHAGRRLGDWTALTRVKLGASLGLILAVAALPSERAWLALLALPALLVVARLARVNFASLLRRLASALPFVLGVASLALFQHRGLTACLGLLAKSSISLLTLQLLASTTPISELLRTLRSLHLPELLCTTIGLLHRYLFVLTLEAARMRRARAGRTLRRGRWHWWRALGNSLGLLFVRTVFRAERVEAAMRSRGGT